jgi:hypothetical protein
MKCNDEDKSIPLRFIEREGMAETFLTRIDYLPPLNFNREKTKQSCSFEYRKTEHNRYLATKSFLLSVKMRSRVEPRV